jgi:plasmid stability protein
VRTTLTLDEDIARKLKAEARRTGKPFRTVVNESLRAGLSGRERRAASEPPFVVRARDLGALRPGLSLDNVGDLLEAAEGPRHR